MTPVTRMAIGIVLATALAAAAGGWAGIQYGLRAINTSPSLDDILHNELDLTADQEQLIAMLESEIAVQRYELENEMRAANHDLAAAITSEPVYGPRAQSAVERFHSAEHSLQEATIQHVLGMRAVLTPEQLERFDEAISMALTSD